MGQHMGCLEELYGRVETCFTSQDLMLHVQSGQQDPTKLMQEAQALDPVVQCRNKTAYKMAVGCSLASLNECLSQVGMVGALPDIDKYKEGFDVVCESEKDFNNDCLKENFPRITACGERVVQSLVHSPKTNKDYTTQDIICISNDVHYDCSQKYLQACDNKTLAIYLEQLNLYQVPKACESKRPGRPRSHYTMSNSANSLAASFLVLSAVASLVSLSSFN
ncbi:hypothetical protein V1264_009794 [Littorina saxatilis]